MTARGQRGDDVAAQESRRAGYCDSHGVCLSLLGNDADGAASAAVDVAADDAFAHVVVVFPDRFDHVVAPAGAPRPEGVRSLAAVPAVIAAALDQIDLFKEILAHVRRPEPARLAVERHAPDV